MKFFKNILILVWRIWFYGWVVFPIIPIFPILFVLLSQEKWYPLFYKIARAWAKTILFVMGFKVAILEDSYKIDKNTNYLFCPNHTSMIDIMLMFAVSKNPFVFVGKQELSKIPIFGYVFKKSSIMVDRSSKQSSKKAFKDAQNKLSQGRSVCIFPEGGVPDESIILDNFKSGAFRMGIEHKIPIVPITFYDCKKRFSYTFFSGSPGKLRVKIHQPITTENYVLDDRNELKQKTYDILYQSLINDNMVSTG